MPIRIFYLASIIVALFSSCAQRHKGDIDFGIDISHHQHQISWKEVPRVQFLYIKATEGATWRDCYYLLNLKEAQHRHIPVGTYHFFRMTSGAHDQFANFSEYVPKELQNLIPMVDVETLDGFTVEEVRDSLWVFLNLVEQHYGTKPMLYSSFVLADRLLADQFNDYPLYVAFYGKEQPHLKYRSSFTIWQYSEKGRLPGIRRNVDKARFVDGATIASIRYHKR